MRDGVNGGGFGAGFWLVFFDLIRHCDWEPAAVCCDCVPAGAGGLRRGPRTGPRRVRGLPAGRRPARGRPGFKLVVRLLAVSVLLPPALRRGLWIWWGRGMMDRVGVTVNQC